MRWAVKHAGRFVLLLCLLVCFGHILSYETTIEGLGAPVIYYLEERTYSLDQIADMKEENREMLDSLEFTAAGSMDQQNFSNEDIGKTLSCDLVFLNGNSSLYCQSTGELLEDDDKGCLLTTAAAWQLFGESHVVNGIVTYKEKSFIVRGVFESQDPVVVMQAKNVLSKTEQQNYMQDGLSSDLTQDMAAPAVDDTLYFDKIILKPAENPVERNTGIRSFENRWGLSNKTDCVIYQRLASFFVMLLPILVFIYCLFYGIRFVFINRRKPFMVIVGVILLAVTCKAYFMLSEITPSIPMELIPSRWSDFGFWSEVIETAKNSILHLIFINKSELELMYFRPVIMMAGYSLMTVVLFFVTKYYFPIKNNHKIFGFLLGTLITELLVIIILRQDQLIVAGKEMLLYIWPYFLINIWVFSLAEDADTKEDKKIV